MADSPEQEARRSLRRRLDKWAKIMCQIVGLERVAEELMGRREWSSYQEIMAGQETKGGEPIIAAPLRPVQHLPHSVREGSRSPMAGGWYIRPTSPEPQPLDLSAKPPKPPASPSKTIFKAKPRLPGVGGRRSYTEDELQAALRDIQSGKLGTRRAAVIYGIPRSTLRNKVYKISQESLTTFEEDEEEEASGAEEERETEQLLNRPLTVQDILRLSSEVRASWPCLQQLLSGASTSSDDQPVRGQVLGPRNGEGSTPPPPQPPLPPVVPGKEQPLDFRRNLNNNTTTVTNNNNNNNNHLEEKKANNKQQQQQQGGKGTRPKRGKYRNYDRDSLVEAVRAVQRGEMSVHRAGSYYGVPHSTLEYKVKERHLMRPRKREPKPQPPVEEKRKEEEKRTTVVTPQLPGPIPNGLKMPVFDPLQYRPPFPPYWQAHFPLFGRPEMFAQELTAPRRPPPQQEDHSPPLSRTAREMAESLLETTESGSFLDGIIRSSLDTGLPSRESGGKVLLEQLCRGTQIDKSSESPPATSPPPPPHSPPSPKSPPPTSDNSSTTDKC